MSYFHYYSEIEQHFQQRRGTILMLSTLDWALMETWREAGVPLEAVLRGIDEAFDRRAAQAAKGRGRTRRVNGLAWAAQAVLAAAEARVDAATGLAVAGPPQASGFEQERLAAYVAGLAARVAGPEPALTQRLEALVPRLRAGELRAEALDVILSALEESLAARVIAAAAEDELVTLREQFDREAAPYRSRLGALQLQQMWRQFQRKRMFEARGLPRLSVFYMPQE